jgi:hypothetical protein
MDRFDEKRGTGETDEAPARVGDVLGLGGSSVPTTPDDPTVSNDPAAIRQRRQRSHASEAEEERDDDPYRQSKGAAGIDMGAGGRATDVSGE